MGEEDAYTISRDPTYGSTGFEADLISTRELSMLTGATYRQLDYWCTKGYIAPVFNGNPGSGNRRDFSRAVVNRVKLITRISNAMSRTSLPDVLGGVIEHYEDEEFNLGGGIFLTWDTVEIERE